MAMKPLSILLIFASLLASSISVSAWGGRKALDAEATAPAPTPVADDAFVTLNKKAPNVVDLARFAVDEYNKEHKANLSFRQIFSAAYTYSSKGVLYGFVIGAADETGVHAYDANVLVNGGAKKLVGFWKNEFGL